MGFFNKFLNSDGGLAVLRPSGDAPDRFAYKVLFHMNFPCRWVHCIKLRYVFRSDPDPRTGRHKKAHTLIFADVYCFCHNNSNKLDLNRTSLLYRNGIRRRFYVSTHLDTCHRREEQPTSLSFRALVPGTMTSWSWDSDRLPLSCWHWRNDPLLSDISFTKVQGPEPPPTIFFALKSDFTEIVTRLLSLESHFVIKPYIGSYKGQQIYFMS